MFQINETFVRLAEGYFVTKHSVVAAQKLLRNYLIEPMNKGKELDTVKQKLVISCLEKVLMDNIYDVDHSVVLCVIPFVNFRFKLISKTFGRES